MTTDHALALRVSKLQDRVSKLESKTPEITVLKIQSLIADKEMATATANRDLARCGDWTGDYALLHEQINEEIKKLLSEV